MRVRAAVVLVLAAAGAALLSPMAHAVTVGIGDQASESLSDPLFTPLGIATVRIVLPWDVVQTDPWRLAAWVDTVHDRGMEPLIAFSASAGDRCPASPCRLPSDDVYRAAFAEVHRRYPWIHLFTPWNEPNHGRQPTAGDPAAAAHFADDIAAECPECAVVAGDVLDAPGMLAWLDVYKSSLHIRPAAWALHNYYDTSYFHTTGTDAFLQSVAGPVWITETGGIVTWRSPDGRVQMPYDEQRAAASLQFGLDLAAARSSRVERVYVYQWHAGPADDFDAALVRADGTPRPALDVLRAALPHQPAPLGVLVPAADAAPTTRPRARALVHLGRLRLDRRGRVHAQIRCSLAACRGRLTLEGRGRIAQRLVNGRTELGTLAPRRRQFALHASSVRELIISLPQAVVRSARRRHAVTIVTVVPASLGDFVPVRRRFRLAPISPP